MARTASVRWTWLACGVLAVVVVVLAALVVGVGSAPGTSAEQPPAAAAPQAAFALGTPTTIDLGEGGASDVVVTPDGGRVLAATREGLAVIDPATRAVLGTIAVQSGYAGLVLGPDGRTAYLGTGLDIEAVDLVTGLVQDPVVERTGGYSRISAISADGQRIFGTAQQDPPALEIADVATGRLRQIPLPARAESIAVTPDGGRAFAPGRRDVGVREPLQVLDTATGRTSPVPGTEGMSVVALSPDGRSLYAVGSAEALVLDVASGAVVRRAPLGTYSSTFAVSPGGRRFYTIGYTPLAVGSPTTVQVLDLETGRVEGSVPIGEHPGKLAVAPDGSALYVTSQGGLTVVPITGGAS